jgi:hypothetical protein
VIDIGDAGRAALEIGHPAKFIVNSFYGSELTLADVPTDPAQSSLTFSSSSQIQGTGTLYVPTEGRSLRPRGKKDPLAAYGQEVSINYVVGDIVNLSLGRFRITDVPSAKETARLNPFVVTGSLVELTLADRFDILQHDSFLSGTQPQSTSAWSEIQRICPIPVVQSLPDALVPPSLTYQNKFDAVTKLMALLGGVPSLTREGALTAHLANAWTLGLDPVTEIHAVIERDTGMSNSLINCVVVTTSTDANIVGLAQIDDPSDPLCVTGPLGRRVKTVQDPLATTRAAATATAQTYLQQWSTQQTQVVTIKCLPRWDIELDDVIKVIDPISGEETIGAVTNMQGNLDPTAPMTIQITEATS